MEVGSNILVLHYFSNPIFNEFAYVYLKLKKKKLLPVLVCNPFLSLF